MKITGKITVMASEIGLLIARRTSHQAIATTAFISRARPDRIPTVRRRPLPQAGGSPLSGACTRAGGKERALGGRGLVGEA
jgi:hypothetical protein